MRVIDSSSLSCSRPPSLASSSPNSSTTTSRRGSAGRSGRLRAGQPVGVEVAGAGRGEQVLAPPRLGLEHHDRAPELLDVEVGGDVDDVGDRAHGVVVDAALEVDDDDRQVVGVVVQAQRHEQRLEELGLARAGRAADEAVRSVADEVDDHRDVRRRADDDRRVRRDRASSARRSSLAGDAATARRRAGRRGAPCRRAPVCSSWSIGRRAASRRALCSARSAGTSGTMTPSVRGWWRLWKTAVSAASVTVEPGTGALRRQPADRSSARRRRAAGRWPAGRRARPAASRSVPSMTTRWTGSGRSTSSSARVSMSCLIDLIGGRPAQAVGGDVAAVVAVERVRQPAGEAPLGAVWSRVSTQMRSSVGECVAASDSTSPRAAACARPLRADDGERAGRQQVRLQRCAPLQRSPARPPGSSAWIADASGARPTHTDVKSASLGLRSHSRRWRASGLQRGDAGARRRVAAADALLAPQGGDVGPELGELGGVLGRPSPGACARVFFLRLTRRRRSGSAPAPSRRGRSSAR